MVHQQEIRYSPVNARIAEARVWMVITVRLVVLEYKENPMKRFLHAIYFILSAPYHLYKIGQETKRREKEYQRIWDEHLNNQHHIPYKTFDSAEDYMEDTKKRCK